MKHSILFLVTATLLFSGSGFCQDEHMTHWYFGMGAGLDFSSGSPVSVGNPQMTAREGSTAYSDQNGDLLFYSNGLGVIGDTAAVWNRNHEIMPNGLLGDSTGDASTMQTSIVVPKPGSASEYYLFTLDGFENYGTPNYKGLCYSIINMTLDNGLGDLTTKAVEIPTSATPYLSEQMTATKHANGTDYWLIVHDGASANDTTSEFLVFLIDVNGISAPTSVFTGNPTSPGMQSTLQVSAYGDRLTYNHEVFDFDNTTGLISNPVEIGCTWGYREFSRSGRFLYVAKFSSGLYQYDLDAADVPASEVQLSSYQDFGQIQLAPDGKMYIAMSYDLGYQPYLSVINNPENAGAACNFVQSQFSLTVGASSTGLPNFIDSYPDASGLEEVESMPVSIFPNPASEEVRIYANGEIITSLRLLDGSGRELDTRVVQDELINYDLSALKSGVYFIEVGTLKGKSVQKMRKI